MKYMSESGQFNHNLHTYQKNLGTTSTLLQISDSIYRASDENMVSAIMSIDESVAFDCVSIDILIERLRMYNFRDNTCKWMHSYLANRTNYVSINTKDSKMNAVQSGVPQGSVLELILYNIYINELPNIVINQDCNDDSH